MLHNCSIDFTNVIKSFIIKKNREQGVFLNKRFSFVNIFCSFILVAALVMALTSCNTNTSGRVEPLSTADEVKAARLVKENIVRIVNSVGNNEIVGTGFFIEGGYLLTNSHIVDIEGIIQVEYFDGTKSTAQLYSNSIEKDVALLKVSEMKALPLTFGDTDSLDITDSVLAVGYAYNFKGEASVTKGTISSKRASSGINYLQSDISMNSGFSGGPLFNDLAMVVGINTFASENGNTGVSISSESLQGIIKELIDNPTVNYLTDERPANSLSNMLVEIGFTTEINTDFFNEKEIIESIKNESIKDVQEDDKTNVQSTNSNHNNSQNSQTSSEKKKSSDATIKSLSVQGYSVNKINDTSYSVIVNQKTALTINVVMTEKSAKYTINGNSSLSEGKNTITINTEAEDGTTMKYTLIARVPLTKISGATKIMAGLSIVNQGENCFHIFWDYADRDGVRISSNEPTDIISRIDITVSAGWEGWCGTVLRPLKTYTYTNFNYSQQELSDIKTDDIRALLRDEEYEGGAYSGADLTFDIKITTKNNGVFTAQLPWGLAK